MPIGTHGESQALTYGYYEPHDSLAVGSESNYLAIWVSASPFGLPATPSRS